MDVIILKDLPKISLNKWYAGTHWAVRNKLKNTYKLIIKAQISDVYVKTKQYHVKYIFVFKSRPLDASNTVAMIKLIEDIIFEDDNYKIVKSITTSSEKGKEDFVRIEIHEL